MSDTTDDPEYSDETFLEAFYLEEPSNRAASRLGDEHVESLGPHESTSRIIAKRVGCTIKRANRRLAELAANGDVEFLTRAYLNTIQAGGQTSKELIVRRIPPNGGRIYNFAERALNRTETREEQ